MVQDVLTQQDKDRCMGVTSIRVRPLFDLQIENPIRHFCFSASDEKQKYLEQILHILSLHNYLN